MRQQACRVSRHRLEQPDEVVVHLAWTAQVAEPPPVHVGRAGGRQVEQELLERRHLARLFALVFHYLFSHRAVRLVVHVGQFVQVTFVDPLVGISEEGKFVVSLEYIVLLAGRVGAEQPGLVLEQHALDGAAGVYQVRAVKLRRFLHATMGQDLVLPVHGPCACDEAV